MNEVRFILIDLKHLESSKSDVGSEVEILRKQMEQEKLKKEQVRTEPGFFTKVLQNTFIIT